MICHYLETQYQYRGHDLLLKQLASYCKDHGHDVVHQKGGTMDVFGYSMPDCEMVFLHEDGSVQAISFSDNRSGLYDFLENRANPSDLFIVSQMSNFYPQGIDKIVYKVIGGSYYEADASIFVEGFWLKRRSTGHLNNLYFKGNVAGCGRAAVGYLKEYTDDVLIGDPIPSDAYFNELCGVRVGLAIPGVGELCHRDIEYMAIGVPMLRLEYMTQMNPALIPNYHYIAVKRDGLPLDVNKDRTGGTEYARRYVDRYLEVRDDEQFLESISLNAKKYYNQYLHNDARLSHYLKLLGWKR